MLINTENQVYLGMSDYTEYPQNEDGYSPNIEFPEYKYGDKNLSTRNHIYEMIREGFHSMKYDCANYGTKLWNPLGEFINQGDTVLIKPNWVMHLNKNKKYQSNLDCLITHPSVVRVVIDYVLIALKGTGRVIVADAPMQGCDLSELFSNTGYLALFEFYKRENISIEVLDLRNARVVTNNKVITQTIEVNRENQSVQVELGKSSVHKANNEVQYKVSDYTAEKTKKYHHEEVHTYSINKNVLQADIIINIPKPKCHRLAGLTAAQKNMVGIIYDKASLPHRAIGSKASGGDEYYKKSIIKSSITRIEEKKLEKAERGRAFYASCLQFLILILYVMVKIFCKDKVMLGSWEGNDTIWRTVSDLNIIAKYADKDGILRNSQQRKVLNIADMIIAGQGNGPIGPYPKNLGIILIGEDSSYIDAVCSKIMGFDLNKINGLNYSLNDNRLSFEGEKWICSNNMNYNKILFNDFIPNEKWRFEPHESWKNHIEV